jgi:hypothetical protein
MPRKQNKQILNTRQKEVDSKELVDVFIQKLNFTFDNTDITRSVEALRDKLKIYTDFTIDQCDGSNQNAEQNLQGECYRLCKQLDGHLWAGWSDWDNNPLNGVQCGRWDFTEDA